LPNNSMRVAIVGLGYVGLTLGVALARRGVMVYGVERRREVVDLTNQGIPHFSEVGLDTALAGVVADGLLVASESIEQVPPVNYYIITVGTPLKSGTYQPRLDMIELATREVASHFCDGAAVILRSTVRIGTTRTIVQPILAQTGKAFHISMCPERTLEGDALRELSSLPQIVGGMSEAAADMAAALFGLLTHAIVRVADPETAEMIKLVDNTSRDVRFAFANEVARACDALGINANDVIRYGKLGYGRTDVARPGLVGGPCLAKDPHILIASVAQTGINLEISAASRLVNERQPAETVSSILSRLRERGPGPFKVVVAGLAFKGEPETDDMRGAMSLHVLDRLNASGACCELRAFDAVVREAQLTELAIPVALHDDLYEACEGVDLLIIANNHPIFATLDVGRILENMRPGGFIYDYWNTLSHLPPDILNNRYFTVGNLAGKF
jgi:UDP-N-acetyl-D-mannosaminuronic acid dehydrogenase